MYKNKSLKTLGLYFFLPLFSFLIISSCGKKDDTGTTGKETDKLDKNENITLNAETPIYVEFKVEGTMEGTIKGWYAGKKNKSETELKSKGMVIKGSFYSDGQMVYIITEEASGVKMGFKMDVKEWSEGESKEGQVDITSWRDKLKEYTKIGTAEVLGKTCDIMEAKDKQTKLYIYKDFLPLKMEMKNMTMTATKYEIDVKITDEMFTPPKDVEFIDFGEMTKGLKDLKNMKQDDLKDKMKELEDVMKNYKK
jgi:hypothetical protein